MALDATRAADVKDAAAVLWTYIVPFMVANKDDYLGMMALPESNVLTPDDNDSWDYDLATYVEDSRKMVNVGTEEVPVLQPKRGPTIQDFRDYVVANAPAADQLIIHKLLRHAKLNRPVVLDKRTSAHPNDVGFYIELDVKDQTGTTWRIQRCKCYGDEPWKSDTEAANTNLTWTEVASG